MKKAKKWIAAIMGIVMLLSSVTVLAEDNKTMDKAQYIEAETGDIIDIEAVKPVQLKSALNMSDSVYVTRLFRNGVYEETIYIDFSINNISHEYADGTSTTQKISDIVTISDVDASNQTLSNVDEISLLAENRAVDYIGNEPISVDSSGNQAILSGAQSYSGYSAMGNRGGYYYAPTTYGYLQRQNAGVVASNYAHKFKFGPGTEIGTAASIILAFYSSTGIVLALSVAIALLGIIIDTAVQWEVKFEVKTFQWNYRVRLNSNTGSIIYSTYRTKDYWRSYNEATGEVMHEYRGSAYDGGFLLANSEMIKAAIDSYLEGK